MELVALIMETQLTGHLKTWQKRAQMTIQNARHIITQLLQVMDIYVCQKIKREAMVISKAVTNISNMTVMHIQVEFTFLDH